MNFQHRYITAHCTNCLQFENSVFCGLEHAQLDHLSEEKQGIFFAAETTILPINEVPKGVYCMYDEATTVTSRLDDEQHKTILLNGQLIGYRSILSNVPTIHAVSVPASTQLCYIPKDTFIELAENNQSLAQKLITLLSEELKKAENHIVQNAKHPIRERLIDNLLHHQETTPLKIDSIRLAMDASDEIIERILAQLDEQGLIRLQDESILILNEQRLAEIANQSK